MATLSRKERRALEYMREQAGLPKAKPWAYQKELAARRREAAFMRELVSLAARYGRDLESVINVLESVTIRSDAAESR